MTTKNNSDKVANFRLKSIVVLLSIAILIGIIAVSWIDSFSGLSKDASTDDDTRRAQAAQLYNAVTEYRKNNIGRMPTDATILIQRYLNNDFSDPDGTPYTITFVMLNDGDTERLPNPNNTMYILSNAVCDNDRQAKYSSSEQNYVVMYHHYGSYAMCVDNQ